MPNLTPAELETIAKSAKPVAVSIRVGMSTCGLAAGAQRVYDTLISESQRLGLEVRVTRCGCLGMCYAEPLVEVAVEGAPTVVYGRVDAEVAAKILQLHVMKKVFIDDHIVENS